MKEWFSEKSFNNTFLMGFEIEKKLHEEQSKFQKIEVFQTNSVGKLLTLDGKTMVSEVDEFVYHEVVSHIPYMVSRKTDNVLIIGGGDGGVVREFTRHMDIKQIDLVEIDERVIEVSKIYFPECTSGLSDPRVNVLALDGMEYIKTKKNYYDIIVIDSTDPEDFASGLFTKDFYQDVYNALSDEGIMVNQTENPFLDQYGIKDIYNNMRKSFPVVSSYFAPMIIYPGVFWTFGFSSKKWEALDLCPVKIEKMKDIQKNLKWYNMDWHKGAFAISNFHKQKIGQDL